MTTQVNGKIPAAIIEAFKTKLESIFPGEKTWHSEIKVDVLCSHHEGYGLHHTPSLGVDLVKNGRGYKILINCRSQGCEFGKILKAAEISSDDLYIFLEEEEPEGCTVEQYARHKGLDKDYLMGDEVGLQDDTYQNKPAVRIPYYDEDGKYLKDHDRWRISPVKKKGSHPIRGLSKKYGGKLTLYGRHWLTDARREGYVLVCEGESDTHSAWQKGWIAVGVPGVGNWSDDWAPFFDGIEKIYVIIEDEAGEKLWVKMLACDEIRDRLYKVVL